jgi:hypothetical protein
MLSDATALKIDLEFQMNKIILSAAILLICSAAFLWSAPKGWYTYKDPQRRFTIAFPEVPVLDIISNTNTGETLSIDLTCSKNNIILELIVSTNINSVPGTNLSETNKDIINNLIETTLDPMVNLVSKDISSYRGFPSADYLTCEKENRINYFKHRLVFNGKTLYHLIINYDLNNKDRGTPAWFTSSLEIRR